MQFIQFLDAHTDPGFAIGIVFGATVTITRNLDHHRFHSGRFVI